ncbi:MAG: NTP transferase domain-containing protein, partial [bacterium]
MESCDTVVILAAGKGIRMRSKTTKLLHPLMGKPILSYLIEATSFFKNRVFIVQEGCKEICDLIGNRGKIAFQKGVLGTGDALFCAKPFIKGDFVVIPGDVPLVSKKTIKRLINFHLKEKADATILAVRKREPRGYGRVIKESG